jgi:hypothetical protein
MQPALKWGALVGTASYLVAALALPLLSAALFGTPDLANPGVLVLGCLDIFLLLFGFSAAGYFTGRETLKDRLGAVAGMTAFVVYAVLTAVYTPHAGGSPASAGTKGSANAVGQAIAAVVADAFVLGLAALMGWLGGRPGAQKARRAREAAVGAASQGETR